MMDRTSITIFIVLLLSLALAPSVPGEGADGTIADEWVQSDYDITFVTFDAIRIDVRSQVFEADLDLGYGVPASTLRELISLDPTVQDDLELQMEEELVDTIDSAMSSLDLSNATMKVNGPKLVEMGDNISDDPYREPLTFVGSVDIGLGPSSLGLPDGSELDELVKGLLKMGGSLNLNFMLSAKAGHLNDFKFKPPSTMVFKTGQATTSMLHIPVDARESLDDMTVQSEVVFASENPSMLTPSIKAEALIDVKDLDDVSIFIEVDIGAEDASKISSYLPSTLGLDIISADGLRMAVANNILSWDEIYNIAIFDQVGQMEEQVWKFVEGEPHFSFSWRPGSLSGFDLESMTGGPIVGELRINASLDLEGMSAPFANAALASGAKVPFEIDIENDMDWKVDLVLPQELTLEGTGLTPSKGSDGRTSFSWTKGYGPISGFLSAEGVEEPDKYGVMTLSMVIRDADTDLGRILGRGMTTIWFDISVEVSIDAVPVVGNLSDRVPLEVRLLKADPNLIRTLLAEGIIDRSLIDDVVDDIRPDLNDRVSSVIGTFVDLRLFLVEQTLMENASGPIMVRGSAEASKEKDINSLDSVENIIDVGQTFPLVGKWGWNVGFVIKMPEGVEITKVERDLPSSALAQPVSISGDKRTYTEVLDGNVSDNVTIYASLTLSRTASEALPQPICFIPLILLLVTMVAVPYWYVRRRKKKAQLKGTSKGGRSIDDYKKIRVRSGAKDGAGGRPPPRRRGAPDGGIPVLEMEDDSGPNYKKAGPEPMIRSKKVQCPRCSRRFKVDPRYSSILCPHCGKKGKMTIKKGYKKVMCPRCKHAIRYQKGDTAIKCTNCGKRGTVRRRSS